MKKTISFILILLLPLNIVSAKTINDLYNELSSLETKKDLYNYLTSDDVNNILSTSLDIELVIDTLNDEINTINTTIKEKEENINKLNEEVNNYLVFNQISSGENIYLEYIFSSEDYTSMIYRYMIAKQLTDYNNNLIEKLNKEIKELNTKKETLNTKVTKLNKQREKYKELEVMLKSINTYNKDSITSTIDEDIEKIKKEITTYQNLGCTRYMNLDICLNIKKGYTMYYPLNKGCVSKDYDISTHKGIDLACNKEGTSVYSSSSGIVASITYKSTCGGNIVYIYHNINGKQYTTIYGHLLEVKVSLGEEVNENTIIGLLGGESTSTKNGGYDRCTTGAHLHYVVVEGYHVNDFSIYTLNPRYINNYPEILSGYFKR